MVGLEKTEIIMSYIDGTPLKQLMPGMETDPGSVKRTFLTIGAAVGRLHQGGIVHGDLTTSNIIIRGDDAFFIDFGLGEYSVSLEARGVDLHLMRRTLESSHHGVSELAYASFTEGYSSVMGEEARLVLHRVGEIRRRGRYVDGGR
jgi:TP53 regulating kinase-like protein